MLAPRPSPLLTAALVGFALSLAPAAKAQTPVLFDIWPGSNPSEPHELTEVNGVLFFAANDGATGVELWRDDGAGSAVTLVKDFTSGADPEYLTPFNGLLYFAGTDFDTGGRELMVSDGTPFGTRIVADVRPGINPSFPTNLVGLGQVLLFSASSGDGVIGKELYKYDTIGGGFSLVKNINPTSGASAFQRYSTPYAVNGLAFFFADDGFSGYEPWVSDGSSSGTVRLRDVNPGGASSAAFDPNGQPSRPPTGMAHIGSTVFFRADDGVHGAELWRSDGTFNTTALVKDIWVGSGSGSTNSFSTLVPLGNELFFVANDGAGLALWKSNGTPQGTTKVHGGAPLSVVELVNADGTLFFITFDFSNGTQLWKSDGTPQGTVLVPNPGGAEFMIHMTAVGDQCYFAAGDAFGSELWKSDGDTMVRLTDIEPGPGDSFPQRIRLVGNTVFFAADAAVHGQELHALGLPAPDPIGLSSDNFAYASSVSDPISTFNGELYTPHAADLELGGPMPLVFSRYYGSYLRRSFVAGALGSNWLHNFDMRLLVTGNTAIYISSAGRVTKFQQNVTTGVWTQLSNLDTPYQIDTGPGQDAVLYDPLDERIYTFDYTTSSLLAGKVVRVEDGHGRSHTVVYDAGTGQLQSVSDGLGRTLLFTYNTDTLPKIETVSDGTRTVLYEYTDPVDSEYLTRVTDTRGGMTTYTYEDTSGNADHALLVRTERPELNVPFSQTFYDTSTPDSGKVATQTDAAGNLTTLDYTNDTQVTDPAGNVSVHEHTGSGEFARLNDRQGLNAFFGSDGTGRRSAITDRLGDTTGQTYHAASGKLASITNAEGGTTTLTYTPRAWGAITLHDLTRVTHADGTTEDFVLDALGLELSRTDQVGAGSSTTRDGNGRPLTETNAAGGTTVRTYGADATLATSTDPAGNTTTLGHDGARRVDRITYADGAVESSVFDAADRLLSWTDGNGDSHVFVHDLNGNLTSWRDGTLATTAFAYDGNDRILSRTDPLGGVRSRTYTPLGEVGSVTDENGATTSFAHDQLGRLTRVTTPEGLTRSMTHDAEGVLTSSTDGLGNTTLYTTDRMGRTTRVTSPLGHVRRRSFDAMGRIASTTDPLGRRTIYLRDARGLITRATLPGGASASYTHDALRGLTGITDPGGNLWSYGRDASGRLVSETDPLGNTIDYGHDARNRIAAATLPGGLGTMTSSFDGIGRQTGVSFSDGTSLTFTHDAAGRLTGADGLSAAYDAAGRLTQVNGIAVGRDAVGRATTMTLAPGKTLTYTYDDDGRVTGVTDWAGGVTQFTYDAAGRRTTVARPNGVTMTRTHDADGKVIGISEGALASLSLTRNALGDIVGATRNVPEPSSAANLATATLAFDAAGQVAGATYDALGRLTADGGKTFTWDLASRLTGYARAGTNTTCTYDARKLRLSRTRSGVTRSYVWNYALGLPSVSVEREGGADLRYWVHTPEGRLLYAINALTNARTFFHFDELGNTLFTTDDAGAIVSSFAHTPFGVLLSSSGPQDVPFTWQGEWGVMDEGRDLYYVRNRYYDAASGRFVSRDALTGVDPVAVNPYQYARGNPLRYVDPTGFEPLSEEEILARLFVWTVYYLLGVDATAEPISAARLGPVDGMESMVSELGPMIVDLELQVAKLPRVEAGFRHIVRLKSQLAFSFLDEDHVGASRLPGVVIGESRSDSPAMRFESVGTASLLSLLGKGSSTPFGGDPRAMDVEIPSDLGTAFDIQLNKRFVFEPISVLPYIGEDFTGRRHPQEHFAQLRFEPSLQF